MSRPVAAGPSVAPPPPRPCARPDAHRHPTPQPPRNIWTNECPLQAESRPLFGLAPPEGFVLVAGRALVTREGIVHPARMDDHFMVVPARAVTPVPPPEVGTFRRSNPPDLAATLPLDLSRYVFRTRSGKQDR